MIGSGASYRFAVEAGLLAAALADPVLLISRDGDLRWGNPAAERLFGVTLAEGVGRNMLEFLHPDDIEIALVAVESMQGKDVGSLLELRIRGADGWRLVEARGASFEDDILLTVRDITERRRWEIAGGESAGFRALIQNGSSIALVLERDGEIRSSSSVLTRLLGHDQERLEGQPLACIVAGGDRATLATALAAVCAPGSRPVTVDLRLLRRDAGAVPFALTFTNLLDDPSLAAIVATGHDISDRVEAEEQLRESNAMLATTLESTAEGILVVDLNGRVQSFNRRFADMWARPGDGATPTSDQLLSAPASHDIVQFEDGRVFECDSRPRRLADEVVGRVWSFRDITEHELLKQQLAHQALHDALTGLPNASLFRDRIDQALARLSRNSRQIAVLFVDLDDFKNVNDTLGHWAGDALLVQISARITKQLRVADTAARLGGDEFAVLIDDLGANDVAADIAQRIVAALREPIAIGTQRLTLTASVGIAYGDKGSDTDELLRNADIAMYAAKAQGKNRSSRFDVNRRR